MKLDSAALTPSTFKSSTGDLPPENKKRKLDPVENPHSNVQNIGEWVEMWQSLSY